MAKAKKLLAMVLMAGFLATLGGCVVDRGVIKELGHWGRYYDRHHGDRR
jgi:hypothetical protein